MFFKQRKKDDNQEILVDLGMYVLEKRLTDCKQEINQEIERLQALCFHITETNDRVLIPSLEKTFQKLKELEKSFHEECELIKTDIDNNSVKIIRININKLLELKKVFKQNSILYEKEIKNSIKVYYTDYENCRRREKIKNTLINVFAFFIVLFFCGFFLFYGFLFAKTALGFKFFDNISNVSFLAAVILDVLYIIIFATSYSTFVSIFNFLTFKKIENYLLRRFIFSIYLTIISSFVLIFLSKMGHSIIITIKPSLMHFSKNIIDQDPVSLLLSFLATLSLLNPIWQLFLKWLKFIKNFSKYDQPL